MSKTDFSKTVHRCEEERYHVLLHSSGYPADVSVEKSKNLFLVLKMRMKDLKRQAQVA